MCTISHVLRKTPRSTLALIALVSMLAVSYRLHAQGSGATIAGVVTDPSGAVIPNAQISVKNTATGVVTNVVTNSSGRYSAPNLIPGPYTVTASVKGFKTEERSGIVLHVGQQQVLNITLQVGQVAQTVSVTGAPPAVQLASATVSGTVNSTTVVQLPLNGRDWTTLATLQPGVDTILTQQPNGTNAVRGNRGFGTEMAISGTRPQLNNYLLDGISIVDYAGGSPGSVSGLALGVDAISEFSVLTANQSAQYGRTAGGIVDAITRSGTNQFHGDAYEFLRNSNLDAANFFDNASNIKIPPFRRNQFGASMGGPIQKNKTFFFADYEGFRQALGITNVDHVPSIDARNGILHNSDGTTTTVTVGPTAKTYLAFFPLPNGPLLGTGNDAVFSVPINDSITENFVTGKIDRTFSEKDSMFGTYFYDSATNDEPDALDQILLGNTSLREMIALEETHIFSPSLVNSVRFGYSRVADLSNKTLQSINPLAAQLGLGGFTNTPPGTAAIQGLTTFGGGVNSLSTPFHYWNSFQVSDDAFATKGNHSLKFGFYFERDQHNSHLGLRPNGEFNFGSLESFLTDSPLLFSGSPSGIGIFGARQSIAAGYMQDDWHVRPNLTLDLGLRYEMATVPTEAQNKQVNLRTLTASSPHLGSPLFQNPTYHNFEPRVGFAWDPFHNGKTAVRGAFGIFDVLPLEYETFIQEIQSAPYVLVVTAKNLPPGSFFPGFGSTLGLNPAILQSAAIQFNPRRNYMEIWNLNIQQQVTPNTMVSLGYVGNHGVHVYNREDDVNSTIPTQTSAGLLFPFPAGSGTRLNPTVGDIRGSWWGGDSEYDALEAQVEKRMSHGVQAQVSYTWGKGLDSGSASVIGDPFTNSIPSLPVLWSCMSCWRGLTDFNIAQTLVVNAIWNIPTPHNWGWTASHVLGGWQAGGIFTAETGEPLTPLIAGDPLGLNSSDPWAVPDRLNTSGCASPVTPGNPNNYIKVNCFSVPMATPAIAAMCSSGSVTGACFNRLGNAGRNTIVGPNLVNLDFSLFKNIPFTALSENFHVQFRAEFFNILNRANFATPVDNEALFDQNGAPIGGAGAIDSTSNASREIQFALKLIW